MTSKFDSKDTARRTLRERLTGVAPEARAEKSRQLTARLKNLLAHRPGLWLGFRSMANEPVLPEVEGVRWAYPVTDQQRLGEMDFFWSESSAPQFSTHTYGMEEPALHGEGWSKVTGADVRGVMVPALGFDRSLRRLGRGGGFYDRYLARLTQESSAPVERIGVGFSEQLVEELPYQSHDHLLTGVITERELIWEC